MLPSRNLAFFAKDLVGDDRSLLHQSAEDRNVRALRVADGLGNAVGVAVDDLDVITLGLAVDDGAVDDEDAARLDVALELVQRRTVHRHNTVSHVDQRGCDRIVGDNDGAVRRAAAHLRAVRGQPGDVLAVEHAGHSQELTDQEHALTAKASKNIFFLHIIQPPCPS